MAQNIDLTLTLDQVNALLSALAEQPYKLVVSLIGEIQKQAEPQVNPPAAEDK